MFYRTKMNSIFMLRKIQVQILDTLRVFLERNMVHLLDRAHFVKF